MTARAWRGRRTGQWSRELKEAKRQDKAARQEAAGCDVGGCDVGGCDYDDNGVCEDCGTDRHDD